MLPPLLPPLSSKVTTFGDGDPSLPKQLKALHDEAVARGEPMYFDSQLGLWVQTSTTLASKLSCCGNGCRHCPFDRAEQQRAGRKVLRPT